jgi:hypothetical protein
MFWDKLVYPLLYSAVHEYSKLTEQQRHGRQIIEEATRQEVGDGIQRADEIGKGRYNASLGPRWRV